MNRRELKAQAREALSKNRWMPVVANLLVGAINVAAGPASPFVAGAMTMGQLKYYNKSLKGENPTIGDLFSGFKNYGKSLGAFLLMMIYQMLWSLIPFAGPIISFVKIFSYALTYHILNDNPELSANEAITKSREMMNGHKVEYFNLVFSFLGWFMLDSLTCGLLGILYIQPYLQHAVAAFYENVKAQQ